MPFIWVQDNTWKVYGGLEPGERARNFGLAALMGLLWMGYFFFFFFFFWLMRLTNSIHS